MKLFRKPTVNILWRKSTNESKRKKEHKFDVAFEQFLELVSVFKESSRNFYLFCLEQGTLKIKNKKHLRTHWKY
jgi:hypothetical protein